MIVVWNCCQPPTRLLPGWKRSNGSTIIPGYAPGQLQLPSIDLSALLTWLVFLKVLRYESLAKNRWTVRDTDHQFRNATRHADHRSNSDKSARTGASSYLSLSIECRRIVILGNKFSTSLERLHGNFIFSFSFFLELSYLHRANR